MKAKTIKPGTKVKVPVMGLNEERLPRDTGTIVSGPHPMTSYEREERRRAGWPTGPMHKVNVGRIHRMVLTKFIKEV